MTEDWITDRRPTEADRDEDGDVRVRYSPDSEDHSWLHWSHVGAGVPWKHCAVWRPATEPEPVGFIPAPTPRKFASISRTVHEFGHTIDAIDDDGVAWWVAVGPDICSEPKWQQLLPLPGREVER